MPRILSGIIVSMPGQTRDRARSFVTKEVPDTLMGAIKYGVPYIRELKTTSPAIVCMAFCIAPSYKAETFASHI